MPSSGHDTAITNTMSQLRPPALGLFKAVMDEVGGEGLMELFSSQLNYWLLMGTGGRTAIVLNCIPNRQSISHNG